MQPTVSFWDKFSREGRIKKALIEAHSERDSQKSLDLLRFVRKKLSEPPFYFHLWSPFLTAFLSPERRQHLSDEDLTDVETMAQFLQQQTAPTDDMSSASMIWQPLFEAYIARGAHTYVRQLAEKLYKDTTSDQAIRTYCVHELVRQRATENQHIDIYISYLDMLANPQEETELFQLLDTLLDLDFQASDTRLLQANHIMRSLLPLHIPTLPVLVPHLFNARGIHALLINRAPEEAREYFEQACGQDNTDRIAYLGLLACELRLGNMTAVTRLKQGEAFQSLLRDSDIATLLDLHLLMQWLDQPEPSTPFPFDADTIQLLTQCRLHRYVGEVALATLGRAYLFKGQAQQARAQFDMLMEADSQLSRQGYYAAWTYALCGLNDRIVECFERCARWSGRWTIACILLHQDPDLAERSGALKLLKQMATTETPLAPIIQARLMPLPLSIDAATTISTNTLVFKGNAWIEAGYSQEEALEALRTSLAQSLAFKYVDQAAHLMTLSWFARLPLADQTFWRGLAERDQSRSLSLLEQAAKKGQHQQAARFLLVRYLRQGQWNLAYQYVEQAVGKRTDPVSQLIQAYINGRDLPRDEAIEQVKQLAIRGIDRAYYLLGTLYLYKANEDAASHQAQSARQQAALAWQRLLASEHTPLSEDLAPLAACASFIAYPQQRESNARTLIQCFQTLNPAMHQPWLEWHVALAVLWYGTLHEFSSIHPTMLHVADMVRRVDDATAVTLAGACASFVLRLRAETATDQFFQFLEQLAQEDGRSIHKPILSIAIVAGLRAWYPAAERPQRTQIEERLRRHLAQDPGNGLFMLYLTYITLSHNLGAEAIALLQSTTPDDLTQAYIVDTLLRLLTNTLTERSTPSAEVQLTALSQKALDLIQTITSGHIQEVYTLLLSPQASRILEIWRMERILPPMCLYMLQNAIDPPMFWIYVLRTWRLRTHASADLILVARCMCMLGYTDDGCQAWEEALHASANDERQIAWREDFVRFLCRQAVSEQATGQTLEAANKLRMAARWTRSEFGLQLSEARLLLIANTLESRAALTRLLAYLFPDFESGDTPLGRYHVLELTLAHNPALIEALMAQDRERIQQQWQQTLQAQSNDMRLLHTLSVLSWEYAFSKQARHRDTEADWITSTALWLLLLSSETFWHYFAQERGGDEHDESRTLTPRQQEDLWQDALDTILVFHSTSARKSLAAGAISQARIHAHCLALGRQSSQSLIAHLEHAGLPFSLVSEPARLEQIKNQAQKLLNDWSQSLLKDAERSVDDARSIARLPNGIRKNYQGGIAILEPFIQLDVPVTRILLACLDWYNDWCRDLNLNGTSVQFRHTAQQASAICEQLQKLCNKRNTYAAENQAIALHLYYRGLSLHKPEPGQAIHFYEEARDWGSTLPYLDDQLSSARLQYLKEITDRHANQHQFEEAYQAIEQAEHLINDHDELRKLRMRISYHHARELKTERKYTEAFSRGRQALALDPTNKDIQRFISEMEELIPEEGYAQTIHDAEHEPEKQDKVRLRQRLASIPASSRFFKQAQDLLNQLYPSPKAEPKRAGQDEDETLDEKKIAEREERLRHMLESGQHEISPAKSREELAQLLARRAARDAKQATIPNGLNPKTQHARLVFARDTAEEALNYDPRNAIAKQTLAEVNSLLEEKSKEKKK
ncbi:hypothetical protein [Dictyobacter aurantiacus]|uniref:Tetratricopeptide repeat protein n=1 Tax=Dictyobacter aurantiacus TaxID=1936993 RepID=A0A401ZL53_9CHLR|nr:hypothetical protein [Dictyobacter aurantiacus]GCE07573.1 hypothetical protein KDAU_49020 [Dictyobacter aurantiacus]